MGSIKAPRLFTGTRWQAEWSIPPEAHPASAPETRAAYGEHAEKCRGGEPCYSHFEAPRH